MEHIQKMTLGDEIIYQVKVHKIMQQFNHVNREMYENNIEMVHVFNRSDLVGYWAPAKGFKPKGCT